MGLSLELRYDICLQPIDLQMFNPVALELLQLLADPDTDIDVIIKTIIKDQALAIQILNLANSSAYSGFAKSETIKDAVKRLGASEITNLAMAASQAALHTSSIPMVNEAMKDLWLHSYACAIGCRSLAFGIGQEKLADHAYLAGLLHDIGKLYLLKSLESISVQNPGSIEFNREALLEVFSDMHVEQGCRIMSYWGIPPVYHSIVANHHTEHFDPDDILLTIVRLVNFNSVAYKLNPYPQFIQPEDVASEITALNVGEELLERLEADMNTSRV